MKEHFETTLWVNNESVDLNAFVEEFLAKTVIGAASSLKGVADVQNLELYLKQGNVKVIVNGKDAKQVAGGCCQPGFFIRILAGSNDLAGIVSADATFAIARQPETVSRVTLTMVIGQAVSQSTTVYALLVSLILIFVV